MDWKFCTYSYIAKESPQYFGKAILKSSYAEVKYNEGQLYSPEGWDLNYLSFFDKLENAILFMIENTDKDFQTIKDLAFDGCFSDAEKIDWDNIEKIYGKKG
jgi:hypothetical protein